MPKKALGLVVGVFFVFAASISAFFLQPQFISAAVDDSPTGARCPAGTRFRDEAAGDFTCIPYGSKAPKIVKDLVEAKEAAITSKGTKQSINYTTSVVGETFAKDIILKTLGGDPQDAGGGTVSYSPGLVGNVNNYIATMYGSPAASSETYVADLLDSAGIAQPAYAQGLGFAALDPILELWKTFRNVAYFFLVVIMLVIGFMIIFQQKVGQTAVTAQQAIPNVIVALIGITFSYAIAGLLIDIMYLLMFLLVGLFGENKEIVTQNIFQIGANTLTDGTLGTVHVAMQQFIDGLLANSFLGGAGDAIGWIGGLAFAVVFAIALAIGIFRLFFALLRTYLDIIIAIVTAPLTLMLGAIPGRNTFGPWVTNLFGNLAVFPIVLLTLIVFQKIKGNFAEGDSSGFLAPFLIGQGNGQAIATMIGMGFVLILPDVVKQAKTAFGVKGGPLEVFGSAMTDAVKRGWTGGELIPGVGATNTAKWGLSGKSLTRTGGVAATTLGGAAIGGATGIGAVSQGAPGSRIVEFAQTGARFGGRSMADLTGSAFFNETRKERQKIKPYDIPRQITVRASKEGK